MCIHAQAFVNYYPGRTPRRSQRPSYKARREVGWGKRASRNCNTPSWCVATASCAWRRVLTCKAATHCEGVIDVEGNLPLLEGKFLLSVSANCHQPRHRCCCCSCFFLPAFSLKTAKPQASKYKRCFLTCTFTRKGNAHAFPHGMIRHTEQDRKLEQGLIYRHLGRERNNYDWTISYV